MTVVVMVVIVVVTIVISFAIIRTTSTVIITCLYIAECIPIVHIVVFIVVPLSAIA